MSTIQLSPLGTYQTNIFADSAAEIVAFDPTTNLLFVTNSDSNAVDILDASNASNLTLVSSIGLSKFGGGVNSVAVKNGLVAVAVEADPNQNPGKVVFFNSSGVFLKSLTVGSLPDAVTFTPDGSKLLVANEGEPNEDLTNDPVGSVSIIDVSGGMATLSAQNVTTVSFDAFVKEALIAQGVRVFSPGASAAQDLEPEFIAVSADSRTAWVTLQENNALAKVNLTNGAVEILPLGFKDHSLRGNEIDPSNEDGGINIRNVPVFGMYQPDSIATYQARGKTYLVMANEGDSRIRPDGDLEDDDGNVILEEGAVFSEESRIADVVLDPTAFPNAAELQQDENLGRLKITNTLGDIDGDGDFDELYAYGGRSFSIRDGNGKLVFDSGADLEKLTAILVPNGFNADDEENDSVDDRSDDKGPEPEALTVGEVNGRTYAFIGLERTGGIVVYDITNPADAEFVQYINTRDFEGNLEDGVIAGNSGDVSPEGFAFISAAESPTKEPLLAVGNEISGSTTLYRIGSQVVPPAGAIAGNNGDNTLYGSDDSNEIYGLAGHDVIYAKAGNDIVYGGSGSDHIRGGRGNDIMLGETGNDFLKGGKGNDLIWGGRNDDTLVGNRGDDNLYGGEGRDYLYGGNDSDFLDGGEGNDVIYGGKGDDFVNGGYGYDYIDGGSGEDTVTLSYRHAGVKIDLGRERISFFDYYGWDTVRNVENAIGTEYGDRIKGTHGANKLYGLGGDDTIFGGWGDDSLFGGDGDDVLDGGYGIDTFDGGLGNDTVTVAYRHGGVNIDLEAGAISFLDQGGQESLKNIENAIGTWYGDQLKGDRKNNRLEGLGGNDILDGTGSDRGVGDVDTLIGGHGADRFVLGTGGVVYYNDGNDASEGTSDYALIKDFNAWQGDVIQLAGKASDYSLDNAFHATGIFLNAGEQRELVAVVEGLNTSANLYSSTFNYV